MRRGLGARHETEPERYRAVTSVQRYGLNLGFVAGLINKTGINSHSERISYVKFTTAFMFVAVSAVSSFAADTIVRWQEMKGVITSPNVDNPVAGISAGTLPWTTRSGNARVDLTTGVGSFDVEGLVL